MGSREGQQLGNYRLLRLLGQGGFAEVYLGEHLYLKSQAAVKLLRVAFQDGEQFAFLQEARTLVRLSHPHIVRVLDFAVEEGTPFLIMEYASHGTLRQKHPPGSRLALNTIITYVRQIAMALQYAHDQQIIHRDVKPENMLFGSQDEILLSDFGLALFFSQSQAYSTLDMARSVAGTSPYLAPEHLQGAAQPASDQYALGVVIYEWLCGMPPFRGTPIEIALQHLTTPPAALCEQVPDLPLAIEQVVLRALAKDPQQRFGRIQDFGQALEEAYQPQPKQVSSTYEVSSSRNIYGGEIKKVRILIADDHPLFRHGLTVLLAVEPDIEVVGEATGGEEVISQAAALQPDVILMDIQMPGVNGIEATRRILQNYPHMRILIITMFEDDASVFTAMRAGARGYVLKDAHKDDMLRAIHAVGRGEAIFSPAIAMRMMDFFAAPRPAIPTQAFPELTVREHEILTLIAQGQSNAQIATQLVLSPPTVRNYVSNIFSKLQVADRAHAIVRAREGGLG